MNTIKLKRDTNLENNAVESIFSMFTTQWEDTSKLTAREEMAIVLSQIKDACLSYSSDVDTEEHILLSRCNQYLTQLIENFRSSAPLSIAISGNDLQSCIRNLELIRQNAPKDRDEEVGNRINSFRKQLIQKNLEFNKVISDNKAKALILSPIIGFGFTLLFLSVFQFLPTLPTSIIIFIGITMTFIVYPVALGVISNKRH